MKPISKSPGNLPSSFYSHQSKKHTITSYHVADNRETLPAIIAMNEAIRTADPDQKLTLITDANPSYTAGIMFLTKNVIKTHQITLKQVIGLQNLDEISAEFRPFKQSLNGLTELLNSTSVHSVALKPTNGAIALTTLIVTHYNFLRPHMSLDYKVPIDLPELQTISTIQGRWAKILSMAT